MARVAWAFALGLAVLAPWIGQAAGPARSGKPEDPVQQILDQAKALFSKLDYERALEQARRANEFSRNADDDVKISLVEGVMLSSLGRDEEADAAFRKAMALDPAAQLPFLVSPKIEHKLESIRTEVKKAIPRERALPSVSAPPDPKVEAPPAAEPVSANLKPAAWTVGAAGLALAIGGGVSLWMAKTRHDGLTDLNTPPATALQYRNEGPVWQTSGWVLVSAGAAALATSALLFGLNPGGDVEPVAVLSPGGGSVGVVGVFR